MLHVFDDPDTVAFLASLSIAITGLALAAVAVLLVEMNARGWRS